MKLVDLIIFLITAPVTIPICLLVAFVKLLKKHPVIVILGMCLLISHAAEQKTENAAPAAEASVFSWEESTESTEQPEILFPREPVVYPVDVQVQYYPEVDPIQASLPWSHRNGGVCRTLKEDASVVVIFLEDDQSRWTEWEMNNYLENMVCPAFDFIEYYAGRYGHSTDLDYVYYVDDYNAPKATWYNGSVSSYSPGYFDNSIHENVAQALGYTSSHDMLRNDRNYSGNDQIAYLYVLDKPGRSYAYWNSAAGDYIEGAVLFTSQNGVQERANVVAHELMHLFGAEDIYAEGSENVNRARMAQRVCPNEIFLSYRWNIFDNAVSDFNAYAVGWLDYFPEQYRAAEWWS